MKINRILLFCALLSLAASAAFLKTKILNSMYPLFYSQNRLLNGREAAV
jgi:hypothetical protein